MRPILPHSKKRRKRMRKISDTSRFYIRCGNWHIWLSEVQDRLRADRENIAGDYRERIIRRVLARYNQTQRLIQPSWARKFLPEWGDWGIHCDLKSKIFHVAFPYSTTDLLWGSSNLESYSGSNLGSEWKIWSYQSLPGIHRSFKRDLQIEWSSR